MHLEAGLSHVYSLGLTKAQIHNDPEFSSQRLKSEWQYVN